MRGSEDKLDAVCIGGGKEFHDEHEKPVKRVLCIPRSLDRSDTRGIKRSACQGDHSATVISI